VKRSLKLYLSLVLGIFLVSCGASPTQAPTPDLNILVQLVAQRVVETVQVQLTQAALMNPTATPAPTNTPQPSNTPAPTMPVLIATATSKPVGDKAEFLYAVTFPENRSVYVPNEEINIAWGLKNVGSITWTQGYRLVYVGGEAFTARYEIPLGRTVAPGDKAEFAFGAFGSEQLGAHTTYWQLVNEGGAPVPGGYVSFTYTSE
jgi:hypothetical protein